MDARPVDATENPPLAGLRFAVVGAGRLGASLALALRAAGAELTGFTCASPAGRARAAEWLGAPAAGAPEDLAAMTPDLYVLSVPDAALPAAAADLAAALTEAGAARPAVLHTSGATSVHVLDGCARRGARTFAFHPLQTFSEPLSGSTRFAGCAVAITTVGTAVSRQAGSRPVFADESRSGRLPRGVAATGSATDLPIDPAELAFHIARALGATPFTLADEDRVLYHTAACVASNYLVTLEACAEQLFVSAGMPQDEALGLFLPLVQATLDNLARQGPVAALTGPLSRGDAGTVSGHLKELAASAPDALALYRCMGLATLDLVRARGDIDPVDLEILAGLLDPSSKPPLPSSISSQSTRRTS